MNRMDLLRAQLSYTLREADFPGLGSLYRGKVRDNFSSGDRIVMVTTDRLSAFDRVLTTVPFKGEVLNRLTVFWFEKTKEIVPNHILDVPDPSVLVVRKPASASLPNAQPAFQLATGIVSNFRTSSSHQLLAGLTKIPPLLGGEGRGEGELMFPTGEGEFSSCQREFNAQCATSYS